MFFPSTPVASSVATTVTLYTLFAPGVRRHLVVGYFLEGEIAVGVVRRVADPELASVGALQRQATVGHVASIVSRYRLGIRRRVGIGAGRTSVLIGGVLIECLTMVVTSRPPIGASFTSLTVMVTVAVASAKRAARLSRRHRDGVAIVGVTSWSSTAL